MQSILFIHQSAELYGSDKTMLYFLSELDKTKYVPIIVLPFDGPLKIELEKNNIKVVIAPVLKLYRKMFSPKNLLTFFKEYKNGIKTLDELHKIYNFKLVYSHTLAALIGVLFAKKQKIKHLWHVQEIIAKPIFFNFCFKKILSLDCNHKVVYDSIATMNFWIKNNASLTAKSEAVWNGIETKNTVFYPENELFDIRSRFFMATKNDVVIALVGRINSWKGQMLLLNAFQSIAAKYPAAKLVFLGSAPPNQEVFETDLKNKIQEYHLEKRVVMIPFQKEIQKFWNAIDIAVVPSTEPEPFGMVVIEAMLAKKPVVASNHGGPTEIVAHNKTGFLFEPNNKKALADAISKLYDEPELRKSFGENGYNRVLETFSLQNHVDHFEKIFSELIPNKGN